MTFIDYTKNPNRMAQYLAGRLPVNYHAYIFTGHPQRAARRAVPEQGGNVAVVFGTGRPETWHGFAVIDGDKHDVRVPAMDGHGVVVGLTPKGAKAKRDDDQGLHCEGSGMTRIAIPTVHVADCRHITITKDKAGSVEIDFDAGAFTVFATGDIELEIVETDSQAGEDDGVPK